MTQVQSPPEQEGSAFFRDVGALRSLLDDKKITDIALNCDGKVWVKKAGARLSTELTMSPPQAMAFLRMVAKSSGKLLNDRTKNFSGVLPGWAARVEAAIPPIVVSPSFAIRMPAKRVYLLESYEKSGVITPTQRLALVAAVVGRQNILVGGAVGSGKTTFSNSVVEIIARETTDRLYIAEDTPELNCNVPNRLLVNTGTPFLNTWEAVRMGLRFDFDRIIVGEVRDGTAHALRKAWATGHRGGVATIHADSAPRMLSQFQTLAEEHAPVKSQLIAEAIDICVHLASDPKHPAGRRATGVVRVDGYDERSGKWLVTPIE